MTKPILLLSAFLPFALLCPAEAKPTLTPEDRQAWILCLKRVKMKPPCCGACRIMTESDLKTLWNYLTSEKESEAGKTAWEIHKDRLLEEFQHLYPDRFKILYENQKKPGGPK